MGALDGRAGCGFWFVGFALAPLGLEEFADVGHLAREAGGRRLYGGGE